MAISGPGLGATISFLSVTPKIVSERSLTAGEWLARVGVGTLCIEPGSPWENGYIESFNGKLRDELLNLEIFDTFIVKMWLVSRDREILDRLFSVTGEIANDVDRVDQKRDCVVRDQHSDPHPKGIV